MRRIVFSDECDDTFMDMCLRAFAQKSVAVKIVDDTSRFPTYRPCIMTIDMFHEHYKGYTFISGRQWREESKDYEGPPVFIEVSSIDSVTVL